MHTDKEICRGEFTLFPCGLYGVSRYLEDEHKGELGHEDDVELVAQLVDALVVRDTVRLRLGTVELFSKRNVQLFINNRKLNYS